MNRVRVAFAVAAVVAACGSNGGERDASPSTFTEPSAAATVAPPVLATFTSTIYPYTIGYPTPWSSSHVATRALVGAETPWLDSDAVDYLAGGEGSTGGAVIVAAARVPAGTTPESWFADAVESVCGTADVQESLDIDGEPGLLSTFPSCNDHFHLWAVAVHGDQAFHVIWLNIPGSEARDRGVFDQILASVRFMN